MTVKGKRINVHIAADDVPILERFKESGGNVSALLRRQLHRWERLEKLRGEHEDIKLYMTWEKDKRFFGSWVWREFDEHGTPVSGVAYTRKGKFLHYWNEPDSDEGRPGTASYKVYDSVDDIDDLVLRHRTQQVLAGSNDEEFLDI